MHESAVPRAIAAAQSIAVALDLTVDDAIVLQDSYRLLVRLMPCDVVARIAPIAARERAEFEVELARRLAASGSPVVTLDPRVEPRVYARDDFAINLWTYCEPIARKGAAADYAHALEHLHAGMREIDLTMPHFTDRVAEAHGIVTSRDRSPALADADREFLVGMLERLPRAIVGRGAAEQALHGEPHPGNVLPTRSGLLFIDLETCCRGPVEFDVAHMPEEASAHYPGIDLQLMGACRTLSLAMVAAWRWDRSDDFPNGRAAGQELIRVLRRDTTNGVGAGLPPA